MMSFESSSETFSFVDEVVLVGCFRHDKNILAVFSKDFINDCSDSICFGWYFLSIGIRIGTKWLFLESVRNILNTSLNLAGIFEIYSKVPALSASYK